MGALFSNRYLDALAKTVLFFGITHLAVLSYAALRGNVDALNAFSIVSLNLVVPGLGKGLANFALSYCMVLAVYLIMRLFPTRFLKMISRRVEHAAPSLGSDPAAASAQPPRAPVV